MSARFLDLAARPFANVRPLRRVAVALWVIGTLLAVANIRLYLLSFTGLENTQQELADVRLRISQLEQLQTDHTTTLQAMDLGTQNEQVDFLNQRIAERTFAWGDLFDRLGEVLPDQVRLTRLSPKIVGEERGARRRSRNVRSAATVSDPNRVHLQMTGTAEGDEPLLDFIDQLYDDPAFADPSLASEARDLGVLRTFTLSVSYLPNRSTMTPAGAPPAEGEEATSAVAEGGTDDGGLGTPRETTGTSVGATVTETTATGTTPDGSVTTPPTVTDRTGEGRYYGADDPRSSESSRRRVSVRDARASRERSAESASRPSPADRATSTPGIGGLQYVGGNARPPANPSETAPTPLGSPASATGAIR